MTEVFIYAFAGRVDFFYYFFPRILQCPGCHPQFQHSGIVGFTISLFLATPFSYSLLLFFFGGRGVLWLIYIYIMVVIT